MENHLVLGLGGTGGKIIRSMRKLIYNNLRKEDPENVRLRYLYVDSDDSLMHVDDDTWKALGKSLQLSKQSQLEIAGMNMQPVLDNIQSYPGIQHWIGNREQWKGILQSSKGAKIAGGQKRRLGRFLLASKVNEFGTAVDFHVREMLKGGTVGTNFHICAGLAGGTGSGGLIDVICQIRKKHYQKEDRIILYLLLPDRNPPKGWAGPNYHANGFAALLELNALAVGEYQPHDISGKNFKPGDPGGETGRMRVQDPFNCCYVFTNENEAGFAVDLDQELPDVVGSFLYHKIITAGDLGKTGLNRLYRQENYEIGAQAITGERESSEGPETRSRRFFAFGVKQLAYPEGEIREYLAFSFAQQAALQLRYNNWTEGVGYSDRPRQLAFDEYVRNRETQQRWHITDSHLTLSTGILEQEGKEKKWREIPVDWSSAVSNFLLSIQEDPNRQAWLDKLYRVCNKRFSEDFRGTGVPAFYSSRRDIRPRHVQYIRNLIEKDLFAAWVAGDQSMQELAQMLGDLSRELEERYKAVDGKLEKYSGQADSALRQMQEIDREWNKIGVFSGKILNKHEKVLRRKAGALEQYFTARTWVEAWGFAKDLLRDVIQAIGELHGEIDMASSRLTQAIQDFDSAIASRCVDVGASDTSRQVVRFYDPKAVRDLGDRLIKDEEEQKKQSARMRNRLAEEIGPNPTFVQFNERLNLSTLRDILEKQADDSAAIAHNNLMTDGGREKALLNVSIVDKLYERFGSNQQLLRVYLEEVVKQAQVYARFSDAERGRSGPGIPGDESFATFTIIIPESDRKDFLEILTKTFRDSVPAGLDESPEVVTTTHRDNEIVILNITSGFPLRFLEPLIHLRSEYQRRMDQSKGQAALEVHIEADGDRYPRIFEPDQEELQAAARPFLLLANALELLEAERNRDGQVVSLSFTICDENGMPQHVIPLGANLSQAAERTTAEVGTALRDVVYNKLADEKYSRTEEREGIVEKIVAEVSSIKNLSNTQTYLAFGESGRKAIEILKNSKTK